MGAILERSWTYLAFFSLLILLFNPHLVLSAGSGDVVINEIAWMGTDASSANGWLELYNNTTDKTFDLSKWSIYGADSGECLNFSAADGSKTTIIESYGYILYGNHEDDVNRDDGTKLVDIWDATIGMTDSSPGEIQLYDEKDCTGTEIDAANGTDGDWFAGNSDENRTMERISPCDSGTDPENWGTNDPSVAKNGEDADGNPINGTPGAPNSVYSNTSPVARINSPDSMLVGETIQLDGSKSTDCDGFIASYQWDLDADGSYDDASGETTTYTFSDTGDKTIGLKVVDNNGGSEAASKTISVTGGGTNLPPDADPGGIYTCDVGETVTLDASGSSDPDGTIAKYGWDFDGNENYDDASGVQAEYSCGSAGVKSVGLKVTDDKGATDTATTAVDVTGYLTVNFSYTPSSPIVGEKVQFSGDASTSGSSISSWEWDFDDGKVASIKDPVHSFGSPGNYSVKLTVWTEAGWKNSKTKTISIQSGVEVDAGENRRVKLGGSISLHGKITIDPKGEVAELSWSVTGRPGGGGIQIKGLETTSPVLIPDSAGKYTLKLTGETASGGRGSDSVEISVEANEAVDPDAFGAEFVSKEDPSYEQKSKTGLEAEISGIAKGKSGSVIGYHLEEPPEYDGEERTAVSFRDLKVLGLENGTARVRYYYEEDSLPEGTLEEGLRLAYHRTEVGWVEADSGSVHASENYVAGEISVTDLKGTPLALTGKTGSVEGEKIVVHGPNPVPKLGCIFWLNLPDGVDGGTLKLYDARGKVLFTREVGADQERFPKSGRWKPVDNDGSRLQRGLYLYRLKTVGPEGISWSKVRKLVVEG